MMKFRRLLGTLGVRLAAGFALIAMISAAATGAVLFWSSRDNILRAEQDRLLANFATDFDKLPSQLDLRSFLASTAPVTTQEFLGLLQIGQHPSMLLLPRTGETLGFAGPGDIPPGFLASIDKAQQPYGPQFLRTPGPNFIIAQTKSIRITQPDLLPPQLQTGNSESEVIDVVLISSSSLYSQQAQLDSLTSSAIWLTVVVGIGAAAVGVILARQLVRPVKSLRLAVQDLGSTGEAAPLTSKGISELGGLIESFNTTSSQLHTTMSELTESESRARRFVADVSHELRTPLTAMVASAEVLENPAASRADASEAARLTSSSARRLAKLTDDLLEISRFDAGHASVQVAPFDATARFLDLAAARHWPETVTLRPTEPLQIMTDPRRWDVIVGNLVANALNHGSAPVVVDARIVEDIFQLEVQDAGPGIPAEDQLHIFDRFFKADSSRSADGTGLGLALVAENCALLGGNISVQSTPGATVFIIELPVRSRTDSQL